MNKEELDKAGDAPKVEEIARQIAEKLVAHHLSVWQGLEKAIDLYTELIIPFLRPYSTEWVQPRPLFMWQDKIKHSNCYGFKLESLAGCPNNADFYVRCSKCKTIFSCLAISE